MHHLVILQTHHIDAPNQPTHHHLLTHLINPPSHHHLLNPDISYAMESHMRKVADWALKSAVNHDKQPMILDVGTGTGTSVYLTIESKL